MNHEQIDALQILIAFANDHVEDVYGDPRKYPEHKIVADETYAAADTLVAFLSQ